MADTALVGRPGDQSVADRCDQQDAGPAVVQEPSPQFGLWHQDPAKGPVDGSRLKNGISVPVFQALTAHGADVQSAGQPGGFADDQAILLVRARNLDLQGSVAGLRVISEERQGPDLAAGSERGLRQIAGRDEAGIENIANDQATSPETGLRQHINPIRLKFRAHKQGSLTDVCDAPDLQQGVGVERTHPRLGEISRHDDSAPRNSGLTTCHMKTAVGHCQAAGQQQSAVVVH